MLPLCFQCPPCRPQTFFKVRIKDLIGFSVRLSPTPSLTNATHMGEMIILNN
jgi:hypothetical protein